MTRGANTENERLIQIALLRASSLYAVDLEVDTDVLATFYSYNCTVHLGWVNLAGYGVKKVSHL